MHKVIAVANGYYGSKVRVPGETFGIDKPEDFSIEWMETDDAKVLSYVRSQTGLKPADDATREERQMVEARNRRYKDWLDNHKKGSAEAAETVDTRRVNTGGTDGVVGEVVKKDDAGKGKKGRKAADAAIIPGSDNDDRSRDMAVDRSNDAPAPDWEAPKPVQD